MHSTPPSVKKRLKLTTERREQLRRYKLINQIAEHIEADMKDVGEEDRDQIIKGVLKKIKYLDDKQKPTKRETRGRKMTPFNVRKKIWDFYHQQSQESTLTSRPAKLRVEAKPKNQQGLEFAEPIKIIRQRNRHFYEALWRTLTIDLRSLYKKFKLENPDMQVSYGVFFYLRPFYVRSLTERDIQMCVCKKHLHARWSVAALVSNAKEQEMDLPFTDYESFFSHLTNQCEKEETTYISWNCTPSAKELCQHIKNRWEEVKKQIQEKDDKVTTMMMQHFVKEEVTTKEGKKLKKLRPQKTKASMSFIIQFIDNFLVKFIHHRNELKHFRSTIHTLRNHFATANLSVDLSENLKVPVKKEPQGMHWSHIQVTVHSAVLKTSQGKQYHPYLSEDRKHDQQLTKVAIKKVIRHINDNPEVLLLESDNCKDYKSLESFKETQDTCNDINIPIIHVYGVPEHGKSEVDHVGGIAKTTLRRAIAGGTVFDPDNLVPDMIEYLRAKFEDNQDPSYEITELTLEETEHERKESRKYLYGTINGTSSFRAVVFTPNSTTIRAAPRVCVCEECLKEYGSCTLFKSYELPVTLLKQSSTRSKAIQYEGGKSDTIIDLNDSFCAIAPSESSTEPVWFVKIISEEKETADYLEDDSGHQMIPNAKFYEAKYLESISSNKQYNKYKLSKKTIYLYKESIIYPFANFIESKKEHEFLLSQEELCEILVYVDEMCLTHI